MSTQRFEDPQAPAAELYSLGTGRYRVLISETGAGQSNWDWMALTRSRNDPIEDDLGTVIYLRDLDSGAFRSVGYQPTRTPTPRYRTQLGDGRFVLEREDDGIGARLEVSVDPALDLERRSLVIVNGSDRPRRLEVTSCLEAVLFHPAADAAHPAFAKLFVQTERDPESGALLARRRPRSAGESWPWLVHALFGTHPGTQTGSPTGSRAGVVESPLATQWETDRAAFVGRGRSLAKPLALTGRAPLSGTVGNVLDPILALRTELKLAPGDRVELTFLTGAAPDRAAALGLLPPGARAPVPESSTGDSAGSAVEAERPGPAGPGLLFDNGYGGFSPDGRDYVIRLPWLGDGHRRPPQPWINVIANPSGGCLVSESGAGYTWARNSQANRLTPWSNDPVSDPHGEALYLRDESTGEAWSPLPGPRPAPVDYECRHGLGWSGFRCEHLGLAQETTVFVPLEGALRILRLRLTNLGTENRTLSVFAYQRLVMGNQPLTPSPIVTAHDPALDLLTAVNPEAGDFAGGIAYSWVLVDGAAAERRHSGDRLAFVGRHRDAADPAALAPGADLDGRTGAGLDPCLAHQLRIEIEPGREAVLAFLLGESLDESGPARAVRAWGQPGAIEQALAETRSFWEGIRSRIQVETPEPAIDLMLNGWALYQNLSCRIWGRSAFYQSGGAYGYRDQLQDSAALAPIRPDLTRAQILLHAAHQLVEGDVLHWWHPAPMERGLRTRFADDLLWLPFVAADYLRVTGDWGLLDEEVPYLQAEALDPGEDERYLKPGPSGELGDLYDHCCRALDRSLTRGEHGLPLMGTGDWNDGMNRVGREGRGESVWMGFFLYRCLADFLPICDRRGDRGRAAIYRAYRDGLAEALERGGWDGAWYRRAYYDDGTPLGAAGDPECEIDALAQAWSVLSGAVPKDRAERAIDSMEERLVCESDGLIRLLAPPFVDTPQDPGYIKGYVAGVRENGGQYTHAACWAVMALAGLGRRGRAARLLAMLSPASHTTSPESAERYRLEPYAVAADIYGAPPHVGRGGWSWYTGSAGWWYRAALESVLGIRLESGRTLAVRPCIPADWPGFRVRWRLPAGDCTCAIRVENGGAGLVAQAWLDGEPVPILDGTARAELPLGQGEHLLEVRLG